MIRRVVQRFKEMPSTLAMVSGLFGVFGALLIISVFTPGWNYRDQPVSYIDFWRMGGGPLVLAAGAIMLIIAFAFFRAQRWICIAIPIAFAAVTIGLLIWPDSESPNGWIGTLPWALSSSWYLRRKRDVVAYFTSPTR